MFMAAAWHKLRHVLAILPIPIDLPDPTERYEDMLVKVWELISGYPAIEERVAVMIIAATLGMEAVMQLGTEIGADRVQGREVDPEIEMKARDLAAFTLTWLEDSRTAIEG